MICEPELFPVVLEAKASLDLPIRDIWIFHPLAHQTVPPGQKSWTELLNKGETDWVRFDDKSLAQKTTAFRLFSSGTTGLPKPANVSHQNLIAQFLAISDYKPLAFRVSLRPCLHPCLHFHPVIPFPSSCTLPALTPHRPLSSSLFPCSTWLVPRSRTHQFSNPGTWPTFSAASISISISPPSRAAPPTNLCWFLPWPCSW